MQVAVMLWLALIAGSPEDPHCRIELRPEFAAAPAVLFPYLVEPKKIRWLGPFRLVKTGRDVPHGEGSVRRVWLFAVIVDETITVYDPPHAVHYRVTKSRSIREHLGRMQVVKTNAGGSRLRWSIQFDSKRSNPSRHCRRTQRYLERALRKLRRRLPQSAP